MVGARRILRGAKVTLAAAAIVGWAITSHLVAVAPPPAGFGTVLFAVAPLFVVLVAVAWRTHPAPAVVAALAGIAALWIESPVLAAHLPVVYLLESVSTDSALMVVFGASLREGHEPLCSRLAAMIRGRPLLPAVARYTRQVTIAWTVFFAAMIVSTTVLFLFAPIEVWSVFNNLLAMPLIGAMFVGEYLVRRSMLRDVPHVPIGATVHAWFAGERPVASSERAPARPR